VQITARSDRDLTPESIVQKVADASGSKYSSSSTPTTATAGPPPPVSSKPAFTPSRSTGQRGGFNPLAARGQSSGASGNTDADGWGDDAPPVTRSQLEKVQSAYKPTKVDMAALTKEPSSTTSGPERVGTSYQPVGKVDIAEIRRQAQKTEDDRPTIVKGAYEPIGKVDIAAIRAKAQPPREDSGAVSQSRISPAVTGQSGSGDEPRSLTDRSSAFTQSERLTSLPKPKIANKFGSNASNFTGTKAPTPGGFGMPPKPAAPVVGAASKTFADEGGKTPAQIWAEKKARERGDSGAGAAAPSGFGGPASPIPNQLSGQTSGNNEWKSGYAGKSWASVVPVTTGRSINSREAQEEPSHHEEAEEVPAHSTGGVGALKDRFKGAAPMGAPGSTDRSAPSPPPLDVASKPTSSAPRGGVAMPGFPPRPQDDDEEDTASGMPPPPPQPPRSATPPTPDDLRSGSPIQIAMPVGRGNDVEIERPDQFSPPLPVASMNIPHESELTDEPAQHGGEAAAHESLGTSHAAPGDSVGGKRALVQYDYAKAEENELELKEGEFVTNIEMVDEDWWMGQNPHGESGLFPSNYVELVEDEEDAAPPPPAARPVPTEPEPEASANSSGPTATAIYDYEAAEENELSFSENEKITNLVSWHSSVVYRETFLTISRTFRTRTGGLVMLEVNLVSFQPTMSSLMNDLTSSPSTKNDLLIQVRMHNYVSDSHYASSISSDFQ
jgi:drebrin-like protein